MRRARRARRAPGAAHLPCILSQLAISVQCIGMHGFASDFIGLHLIAVQSKSIYAIRCNPNNMCCMNVSCSALDCAFYVKHAPRAPRAGRGASAKHTILISNVIGIGWIAWHCNPMQSTGYVLHECVVSCLCTESLRLIQVSPIQVNTKPIICVA